MSGITSLVDSESHRLGGEHAMTPTLTLSMHETLPSLASTSCAPGRSGSDQSSVKSVMSASPQK